MLHTLGFSLQNVIYFIMLPFLVPLLFTFYIQYMLKFKLKLRCQKVKVSVTEPSDGIKCKNGPRGLATPLLSSLGFTRLGLTVSGRC
jgi:hypothetical protein